MAWDERPVLWIDAGMEVWLSAAVRFVEPGILRSVYYWKAFVGVIAEAVQNRTLKTDAGISDAF